jgi:hypothetical protein
MDFIWSLTGEHTAVAFWKIVLEGADPIGFSINQRPVLEKLQHGKSKGKSKGWVGDESSTREFERWAAQVDMRTKLADLLLLVSRNDQKGCKFSVSGWHTWWVETMVGMVWREREVREENNFALSSQLLHKNREFQSPVSVPTDETLWHPNHAYFSPSIIN